jgi:hypothetical protein
MIANHFESWAVVELFGHAKEVGFVTTEYFGTAGLFRIDVPELPEREFVLQRPEYTTDEGGRDQRWTPVGAKVRRPATPARSRLVGPGAIYSITPCTEATARIALEDLIRRMPILLEMPKDRQMQMLPGETAAPQSHVDTYECCGGDSEVGHTEDCEDYKEADGLDEEIESQPAHLRDDEV